MPLKIAQVATSDISIRLLLLDHIEALQRCGHKVVAICAPGAWVEEIRSRGVEVQTVAMRREASPWHDMRAVIALRDCFRRNRFDAVHTHTPKAGLLGPLAARMTGVPVIVHTIHGLLFHDAQRSLKQMLLWAPEKLTASMSHTLLSQSREDMKVAVARRLCSAEKIVYLGNGINVDEFAPYPDEALKRSTRRQLGFAESDFVVGSVGRLVYEKGFGEFFEAAAIVRRNLPQAKFVVVGPEETEQNDAIPSHRLRELSERGVVTFAGMQSDMRRWYSAMDAFVLPSHREGIPRACLEASAMQLPVIASDIRGCREVVTNEDTGMVVPMKNAAALAESITRLVKDPMAAKRMGERGRAHVVQNFNQRDVLQRLCDFYSHVEDDLAKGKTA